MTKREVLPITILLLAIAGYILLSSSEKRDVVSAEHLEIILKERKGLSEFPLEELSNYRRNTELSEEQILETKPLDKVSDLLRPIYTFDYDEPGKLSTPVLCGETLLFASTTGNIYEINFMEEQIAGRLKLKIDTQYSPVAKRGFSCLKKNGEHYLALGGMGAVLLVDLKSSELKTIKIAGLVAVSPATYNESLIFPTMNPSAITSINLLTGGVNWETRISSGYGSNIWSTFLLTEDKRYVIAASGSPSNWEERRERQSPDNENANKVFVINPDTGRIIFEEQIVRDDYWDWDNVGAPVVIESSSNLLDFIFFNKGKGILRRRIKISDGGVSILESLNAPTLSAHLGRKVVLDKENKSSYIFGDVPPQLKKTRVIDNYSGGPQWYGAAVSDNGRSIYILENKNLLLGQYFDLIPDSRVYKKAVAPLKNLKNCFECHSPTGRVSKSNGGFVPSLSLISQIYSLDSFENFIERSHASPAFQADSTRVKDLYESLKILDDRLSLSGYTPFYEFDFSLYINNKEYKPHTRGIRHVSTLFGTVSRVNVGSLSRQWTVPAGRYDNHLRFREDDPLSSASKGIGSLSWGGLLVHDDTLILTGTLDSRVWLLSAETGAYLGHRPLTGVGTAPPIKFSLNKKTFIAVPTKREHGISMTIFQAPGKK